MPAVMTGANDRMEEKVSGATCYLRIENQRELTNTTIYYFRYIL